MSMYDITALYRDILLCLEPPQVKLFERLDRHTHLKIGGKADLLVFPLSSQQVQWAVACAKFYNVPYVVIGQGSNLIVRDGGVRGMVISLKRFTSVRRLGHLIFAAAGTLLAEVSAFALHSGLGGLEFACGIPGTVGGAVTMNAGAYGSEISDALGAVAVLTQTGRPKIYMREELGFTYRGSTIAKKDWLVLGTIFRLNVRDPHRIQTAMDDFTARRNAKQPLEYPSCGSVFKRPPNDYAGRLIQSSGLQGYRVGGAEVSKKHAGFIVNVNHATASDYLQIIRHIQEVVSCIHGVVLEPEVRIIGGDM